MQIWQEVIFAIFIQITLQTEITGISNANYHALRTNSGHKTDTSIHKTGSFSSLLRFFDETFPN